MNCVSLGAYMSGVGFGERHKHCRFENFSATIDGQRVALSVAKEFAAQWPQPTPGKSLIFTGPPGTGKTHLAAAVVAELFPRKVFAHYTTMQKAVRVIRGTWAKGSDKSTSEAIEELVRPQLLVIDEFWPESDAEQGMFFEILNERYAQRKPCIIVTNLPMSEIASGVGVRALDRLREDGGEIVAFGWESHRGK